MEIASLFLSAVGAIFSITAICMAKSARKIAENIVKRKNEQEDGLRLQKLISVLNQAKEAAKRNEANANTLRAAGRSRDQDIGYLREAQDALRTTLPVSWTLAQRFPAQAAANDIEAALVLIRDMNGSRDGWKNALATIQLLIPRIEQEYRIIDNQYILSNNK